MSPSSLPAPQHGVVVVLGMHRSGTSAVAQGLEALGVSLGHELMPPGPHNPKGFFEDLRVVDLNERVLQTLGLRWADLPLIEPEQWQTPKLQELHLEACDLLRARLAEAPLWGFKDPRTLRVLPFWQAAFEQLRLVQRYVVSLRNPLSVVSSLQQRDRMEPEWAHLLWLVNMVPSLGLIRVHPHVIVDYDRLLSEPKAQLERVSNALGLTPDPGAVAAYAAEFLSTGLRHSAFGLKELAAEPLVDGLTLESARLLDELARDQGAADFWPAWEAQAEALRRLAPILRYVARGGKSDSPDRERAQLLANVADLGRQRDYLKAELVRREALLDELYAALEQRELKTR